MKILHVNKFYFIHGGVDSHYFQLTKLLKEKGHQVIPFSMKNDKNFPSEYSDFFAEYFDTKPNINIKNIFKLFKESMSLIYNMESKIKIKKLIENIKPDIAHLHHIYHQLSPSITVPIKKSGIPSIMTLHDYKLICPNYSLLCKNKLCEKCRGWRFYHAIICRCVKDSFLHSSICALEMFIHKLIKIYDNNIDIFIAPSEFLMNKMKQYGMDNSRIVYIPNFVDITTFIPSYESENYILYFGRLEYIKGLRVLIKAFEKINNTSTELFIVGTGSEEKFIKDYCLKKSINNVRLIGFTESETLKDLIRKSMFVISPSIWYENSPMSILEAMALGKPVIGSNIGGIPEIIEEEKTGFLFETGNENQLADKIKYLLKNRQALPSLGRNAREKIEDHFSADHYFRLLTRVYNEAIYGK